MRECAYEVGAIVPEKSEQLKRIGERENAETRRIAQGNRARGEAGLEEWLRARK